MSLEDINTNISAQMQRVFLGMSKKVRTKVLSFCNKDRIVCFQYFGDKNPMMDYVIEDQFNVSIKYMELENADVVLCEDSRMIPKPCDTMIAKIYSREEVINKKIAKKEALGSNLNILFSSWRGKHGNMATAIMQLNPKV
jgi:hypothetical protein